MLPEVCAGIIAGYNDNDLLVLIVRYVDIVCHDRGAMDNLQSAVAQLSASDRDRLIAILASVSGGPERDAIELAITKRDVAEGRR